MCIYYCPALPPTTPQVLYINISCYNTFVMGASSGRDPFVQDGYKYEMLLEWSKAFCSA